MRKCVDILKSIHSNVQDKEDKEYVGYINLPYIAVTSEILRQSSKNINFVVPPFDHGAFIQHEQLLPDYC